jgi:hypothetical protein
MCLIQPSQMAAESARATITAQASRDNRGEAAFEAVVALGAGVDARWSVILAAPRFIDLRILVGKNKKPAQQLDCWRA